MKMFFCLLFLGFILFWGSCTSGDKLSKEKKHWNEEGGRLKVLSSTAMINDLVCQIGGDYIDSLALIKGELDPHSYQLVKGDSEKIAEADLIFFNGLGLEHHPSLSYHLQSNLKAIGLGDKIYAQDGSLILNFDDQLDPHIWMDISLWIKAIPYIVEALAEKDPAHKFFYHDRALQVTSEMQALHERIKDMLNSIPETNRYLVTTHDAFNYFVRAYLATDAEKAESAWQKRFAAPEGLAPESQLSLNDIQYIIDFLEKNQVHVLFAESNLSQDSIRKIISAGNEKQLNLFIASAALYADAMGAPGSTGDTYLKMMEHNANSLVRYLRQNISSPDDEIQ